MHKTYTVLALLALGTASAWAEQARTIHYAPNEIAALRAKVRFTTVLVLPVEERILDYVIGDRDNWVIEGAENLAYLKPAKEGAATNLSLVTASGNVYAFILSEVTRGGGEPDLKVFVVLGQESLRHPLAAPKLVRAEDLEALKQATQEPADDQGPAVLRFEYEFERSKKPFRVSSIYHDGRRTYIHTDAPEKAALYEQQDGEPALINFTVEDGVYVVPKVLDAGYLALGKGRFYFKRRPR